MASDQKVTARHVLGAVMELRRTGSWEAIKRLEAVEPDLTEYLLETLSAIHKRIQDTGATDKQTRRIYGEVQTLVVVTVLSLQKAHFDLWNDAHGESDAPAKPSDGVSDQGDASPS